MLESTVSALGQGQSRYESYRRAPMSRMLARRLLRRQPHIAHKPISEVIVALAKKHEIKLSDFETQRIIEMVESKTGGDPVSAARQFHARLLGEHRLNMERDILLEYRATAHNGTFGRFLLTHLEFMTTALFAILGAKVAGEAGMNVIGVQFVGVLSSIGGATLNDLLLGHPKGGVFWVRDLRFLLVAVIVSTGSFWLWPCYESWTASDLLHRMQQAAGIGRTHDIREAQFSLALEEDPQLAAYIRTAIATPMRVRPAELDSAQGITRMFQWLDQRRTGSLDGEDLRRLALLQNANSPFLYTLESILTGTAGISGANAAIARGMHPLVCATCSVSISFGGVFRDIFCGRNVALGTSSFAFACGISGVVYVALMLVAPNVSYAVKVLFSIGAACSQRAYCWHCLEPGEHFFPQMALART